MTKSTPHKAARRRVRTGVAMLAAVVLFQAHHDRRVPRRAGQPGDARFSDGRRRIRAAVDWLKAAAGDRLEIRVLPSERAALTQIEDRKVYGAALLEARMPRLLIASAATGPVDVVHPNAGRPGCCSEAMIPRFKPRCGHDA
jgi:hypothetical protein